MREPRRRSLAGPRLLAAIAMALAACTVEPGQFSDRDEPITGAAATEPAPGRQILATHGVDLAPCDAAVNEGNGCIFLGALVDLSGPFADQGEATAEGAQAFWDRINAEGGLRHRGNDGVEARFDVLVDHVADNAYEVERHLEALDEMEPDVAALAVSFGTPTTRGALHEYQQHHLVSAPAGSWSGWVFEPLVADSGAPYCLQAINGFDWALQQLGGGTPFDHLVAIGYPDGYGLDAIAGLEHWADVHRVPFERSNHAVQIEPGGDVSLAVETLTRFDPEAALFATGPDELAAIAKQATAEGWEGLLIGLAPTFAPSLLDDPALERILSERYHRVSPVGPLTQGGEAYAHMREALGLPGDDRTIAADAEALPRHGAWIAGWVSQYPLEHTLLDAVERGDLTRAGIREAVRQVSVDYAGALPGRGSTGAPTERVHRRVFVLRPDASAPLGERLVADAYVGNTAEAFELTRPCTEG